MTHPKQFPCPDPKCDESFNRLQNLIDHVEKSHPGAQAIVWRP